MVVLSSALLGAYLLLSTGTSAFPTVKKDYVNGHGPSVALYDAMSDGEFTGDVTKCNGKSVYADTDRWLFILIFCLMVGYKLNGVQTSASGGILADLSLNGEGCKAFGNDIANLILSVEYETQQRKLSSPFSRSISDQITTLRLCRTSRSHL